MKIAVASQNRRDISKQTGHCRKFWAYSIENAAISERYMLELSKEQTFHAISPRQASPLDDVDYLITGSMGVGLAKLLEDRGIRALPTDEQDPDRAVTDFLHETLVIKAIEQNRAHHKKT